MATNQEIINLVLNFKTAFDGQNQLESFLKSNQNALAALTTEGVQLSASLSKVVTTVNTLKGILETVPKDVLSNILSGSKGDAEIAPLIAKTKELNEAITALKEGLSKKIDLSQFDNIKEAVQKVFLPNVESKGTLDKFGTMLADNLKAQFQKLASGEINLSTFLDNLIPKDGFPKGKASKVLSDATAFAAELKEIVGKLNADSSVEGRASVLNAIAKRILDGSDALNTAKERVTVSSTELSKVIENLVKVASISMEFGIVPPKDLFSKFPEAFRTQGAEQTGLLKGVIDKIFEDAKVNNVAVDKVNFGNILKQMGFDEAAINTQFNSVANAIATQVENLQKRVNEAVEFKKITGTDNIRERVTKLQEDLSKLFNVGMLQGLGSAFETEFKAALDSLKVFETGSTQSLKQFQDFEKGINALKASLAGGVAADNPVAKSLFALLEAYEKVEKEFRLDLVLKTQEDALKNFKTRVDSLKDSITRNAPQEKQFTFSSTDDAGTKALKEKEDALAKFKSLAELTAKQISELKGKISDLETTQKLPAFAGQQGEIQKTINEYNTLKTTLEAQQTALAKEQESWTRSWEKKTADVKKAEESVAKFNRTLDESTTASTISNALNHAKAFAQIGVASDEAKIALQGVFAQFGQFGGISKNSIQAMEDFQRAINTLFASRGTGKDAVTLIDLTNLPTQSQSSAKALEILGEQLFKLTGTSAEAKEQFRQLAFAHEFLQKTSQGGTEFGKQIAELYGLAQAVQLYTVTLDVLKQRQENYVENLTRVKSAQIEVKAAFEALQVAQVQGKDTAPAVAQLETAYKNYAKQLENAEARLKQLENTKKDLQSQQTTLGFSAASSELTLLEAAINSTKKQINDLKVSVSNLGTGGSKTSLLFQGIVDGVNKGNEEIQTALSKLQVQAASKLNVVSQDLQTALSKTMVGSTLATSIKDGINELTIALNAADLGKALEAIGKIRADIQTAFTTKLASSTASKELADTYLKPYQELLKGLEFIAKGFEAAIPKLAAQPTQQKAVQNQLTDIQNAIRATDQVLSTFGTTSTVKQLEERFGKVRQKAVELDAEITKLGKGSFDLTKYNELSFRFKELKNEATAIGKESIGKGLSNEIIGLNVVLATAQASLKDFGKSTNVTALASQIDALKAKFPTLSQDISNIGTLLKEAFAGNKTLIDVAPFNTLRDKIQEIRNGLTDPAAKRPYTQLLTQLDELINKTSIYNAFVKAGGSRTDVGIQTYMDRTAVVNSINSLNQLNTALVANKIALNDFLISGDKTKEGAAKVAEGFATTGKGIETLTVEIGRLSGVSSNLQKHIIALQAAGQDATGFIHLKDKIDQLIQAKKALDAQFKGGSLTGGLEQDLNRLATAETLLKQFKTVGDSFKNASFFDSTSYSARLAYEEIQRLETATRKARDDADRSLAVGRPSTVNPEVAAQLRIQRAELDANIKSLQEMGAVYDQLRSKPKIEAFQQLKTTLSDLFASGGRQGIIDYGAQFQTTIGEMQLKLLSLKDASIPLTETFINNFKRQGESINEARSRLDSWLVLLDTMKNAGKVNFQFEGGQASIAALISLFEKMQAAAKGIQQPIEQASNDLKDRLGTATGQAELRISNLITKFTQLQDRINTLNPGSSINEIYGSVKELMMLLNQPYKTGPFFTLPKEGFAPIRNELLGLLEIAKTVAHGLQTNLTLITPGTTKYKDTELQIKAAREEVERLTAASQKLSEFEKNASHFSALRGNLHGASTTLQELAHEGAFIYKGLEALFKNIAKNIAPKLDFDTSVVTAKVKELNDQFRVTGVAATDLEKKIKEALNAQIGGGGLAAAREYERAFQQLEEAFVKFRSGLTQAAMGFQMLGDALLEPFKKAKEGFEQFSDTMGVVNAVSNATQAQFKALTDQALLMGATTRFTAEQAAEGLKQLAKAGYTAEEQIASLPTVMRLAQAAATDLATAATVATVVMKEFRMDPDQFNVAADKITLAANRTLGTVEDLGYSFKYVGALAANIGADFGDLTAAIGLLHNAGLKGTLSGTALRGMLMALYNPTRDETKLIAELGERIGGLGLQIQDASGNFVGYGKIVKQLEQAGITTGEVLRFFGQRAGPGMAALLAQGSDALRTLEDDLRNAEGTTAHMAEIMEQTLKGRLLLMRSAFEALSDSIGHNLEPTLAGAANVVADFVSRFVAIRQEFPALATAVDHVLAGLALFASTLGGLAVTFAFIIVPVKQFWGFLKTLLITTWAGSAAIGSLSAAMAFNAAVVTRTGLAFERAMVAELAKVGVTAADASATQIHTAVTAINTKALYEQAVAYETATAGALHHATAQVGLWAGIKNALSIVGGLLRGLLGWWGLAIGAVAALVTFTLLHSKSVSQTNIELEKQNQLIEYSRKSAVNLNKELINTSTALKRNQQALADLNSKDNPKRDLVAPENQTTAKTQLQLDIDQNKKDLQNQLKQLITQITESGFLKDKLVLDVSFDKDGNFDKFKVKVVESNEVINVLENGLTGIADTGNRVTSVINSLSNAQQQYNKQLELTNILKEKFSEAGNVQILGFDTGIAIAEFEIFSKSFEKTEKEIRNKISLLEELKKASEKLNSDTKLTRKDINSLQLPSNTDYLNLEGQKAVIQKSINTLTNEISKLSLDQQTTIDNVVKAFVDRAETVLGRSQTEIATAVNRNDLLKFFVETQKGQAKLLPQTAEELTRALDNYYETLKKGLSAKQIVGSNLKTPVIGLVNATKDVATYLEETNKELKKKIDEQKKIFDEAKVVVDAVKAYQTAIAAAAKDTLDVKNQEIEFEAKIKTENLDRNFEEQLRKLEDANRVIDLPFKAKLITETADTSGFKALSGLSGLLLDYEKKNTAEFVKIQSANSERIKEIKLIELNDKQAATTQYYQTLKNHYSIDSADYLKAQQEQASATKENLDSRLEVVQDHLKDLLKLYQDNAKAIIDLEKQKKQFQAAIEQTKVNFGNAQLLPTEQLQKAKFDLSTLDAQIQQLLKEEKFDDAIARLNEYQKLVDQIATSAGAQPEFTLKVANLAENLEFDLDRIDFEKEFNKANIRITTGAKGLGDAFSSTFTKFKPLSSSFVPQLESGAVDVKKALQTVVRVYGEEVDKLKKKDEEGFQGLGEGISTLQYASVGILKSFGKSFDDNLRFKKAQKELETFGDMMEGAFNVRPVTDLVKGVNYLDARLSQVTQAQNALNEFGIPGESASAVPLLSNISETGEKGIVTLRNVKGEMLALSLQAKTEIKPLEGLTTDIQKGKEALIGFKSLIDTQIEDLSRGDKVVELPISFKTDFNAFDTVGLGKYSAEVLSYEKNLNEEVLDLQLKRINATLEAEQKAVKDKQTIVENQITTIEALYDKQLGDMQNWSKQDLDAYKSNIESKKSSLISFLQEELSATQSTYNELFQIRANLLNKNRTLDEQYISFQANATKNFQTIDDLGKSDSQKTYETRLKSLNLQADADAALAQGDYDRAKALLEQRQQLIDAAVSSLKPEDTIGKFFLKQDQTEAVTAYKKVTDALKAQNQSAVKEVEAQLNSVNGQILALKQSADTAKAALQDLLNKLFELSTKKFQAEVEVIQKNTQQAENLGEQAYSGAIAQRQDIGKTLLQDREKVKKEEQALVKLYEKQVIILREIINITKEKQLVKIGIDPDSYEEVLDYAKFYLDSMDAINKDKQNNQLARVKLADLEKQFAELQKSKQAAEELEKILATVAELRTKQKELGGLSGLSNTFDTAITSATELNKILTNTKGPLDETKQAEVKKLLEDLRISGLGLKEALRDVQIPDEAKNQIKDLMASFVISDKDLIDPEKLNVFGQLAASNLAKLEKYKRDNDKEIQEIAQKTATDTAGVLLSSILAIREIIKTNTLNVEVKDIDIKTVEKQVKDQVKLLTDVVNNIETGGNAEQIKEIGPLKDLLKEIDTILKSSQTTEEKINNLKTANVKLEAAALAYKKQQEEAAKQQQINVEAQVQQSKALTANQQAQSTAVQDTAKAQESIVKSSKDAAEAWAKATPNEQFNVLNDIQNKIDEISKDGLQLVNPAEQQQISALFNQLKNAQAGLKAAFESGDPAAITEAITKIKELGTQFKNTAGLSDVARQKFGELANIPSFTVAIKTNTSSIPPAKQAVEDLQATAKKDTVIQMTTDEVILAVTKLKDVENEVTKLKGLSAVEFKGYTTVDVEKSKQELEAFAQRAKALMEVPISARDEEFKAKLRALFVDYDQFRSQLQPIKIEGDASGFNNTYQKALSTIQNLRDQAKLVGATEQAQKYSKVLNELLQARLDIQSNDINIKTQGYEKLKTLINGTKELTTVLTEADKQSLNVKMTTVGKDVVISDITGIGTELDNTKNKAKSLDDTLKEVRSGLSETATVPGLEKSTDAFDELNNKLTDTRNRLKEAFAKGNFNEDSLNVFKSSIQGLIDKMSQVEGVTPDMVKALREAVDIELKDYTLKVIPEVQPLERAAPEVLEVQAEIKESPKIPEPNQPLETTAVVKETPTVPSLPPLEGKVEVLQPPTVPTLPPLPSATLAVNLQIPPVPQVPPQNMIVNPALQPVPALPLMFVDVTPKLVSELPELTPVDVHVNPILQEIRKPSNIWVDVDPKLQPIQKPANIEVDVDPKLQKIEAPETTISLKPEENWAAEITQPETTVILSPEAGWDEKIPEPNKTVTLSPEAGWESKITPPTVTATLQPEWNISEIPQPSIVATVTALVDQAVSGIGQVLNMINQLPSSRTIVINTVYRTSGSPPSQNRNQGGLINDLQYFADGGLARFKEMAAAFVPGIGNTDTVPAMLTPGEFVIKKERVKSLGIGFLNALNSGLLQFKSAGGMIYNSPINTLNKMSNYVQPNYNLPQQVQSAGGPPIDINLTIKDKTFSIKTPRDEAKKLVSALQYLERGITKK